MLRHGARARVEGNFFLGEEKAKSGGIRITDRDHVIVNNYMSGLNNGGDRWNNGITIVAGDAASGGTSNSYQRVDDVLIAYNTIYGSDDPIFFNDRSNYVSTGVIAHNLVFSARGQLVAGDLADTGAGMTYEGNIFGGSPVGITNAAITVGDETFTADGELLLPVSGGLASGAAGTAYVDLVELDLRGLTRPATGRDVGAHEIDGATGDAVYTPITNDDVGKGVGASYLSADGHSGVAQTLNVGSVASFGPEGGTRSVSVSGNVDWTATTDESWITLSPTSGSNAGTINITVDANGSGMDRTGTITVSGEGLSRSIDVIQMELLSPANCPTGTNVAVEGGVATFSSEQNTDNAAANIIDGNTGNRWSAEGFPQFAVVDLGAAFSVNGINLYPHLDRDYQFLVEGSNDPESGYVTLVDATDNNNGGSVINRSFETVVYRYIRLTVTGAFSYDGPWVSVSEFEINCSGMAVGTNNFAAAAAGIILRPVPVTNVLYIDNLAPAYTDYTLNDLAGRTVSKGKLVNGQVDLRSIRTTGMFVLHLSGAGQPVLVEKVIRGR